MINKQLINLSSPASSGGGTQEEGLILHLDANDVDSYDGDGTEWVDISTFDKTIPISDNVDNLKIHYNPSDPDSYSGSGTTLNNLAGDTLDATVVASRYDIDNGGFFDVSLQSENTISVPDGHPLDGTGNSFTLEFWFNWKSAPSAAERFVYEPSTGWNLFYYGGYGWRINNDDCATGYFSNNVATTAGEWNHFAMSQDASNCKVYLNGTLVKTQAVTSGTRNIDSFSFGSTSSDGVNCKIGSIRMYNSALSASEVGQNYRHGRDTVYTELAGTPFLHYDPADTNSYSGTGTTFTDLAGNNDGDLLGGIENSYDEELGNSFDITGSGDGITTKNVVSVNPATNGMTVEMWVYHRSNTQNYIFSFDGTGTTYFGLSYRTPNNRYLWFYRNSSGGVSYLWSKAIDFNKWYHLTITTDGTSGQFYTNGELETAAGYAATTTDNAYNQTYNEDLHFGNMYDLAQNTVTQIGQIRFYKGGLTADEVRQNYNFTKNNYPNGYNFTNTNSVSYLPASDTFDFDGLNDYFEASTNEILKSESTVVIWCSHDGGNSEMLFSNGVSNDTGMFVGTSSTGEIRIGQTTAASDFTFDSTLKHYAFVFSDDGNYVKVYKNGDLQTTRSHSKAGFYYSSDQSWTTNFRIGRQLHTYSEYWDGKVGSVKIYDRVLESSEITTDYNATKSKWE